MKLELTKEEELAIRALKRVAKRWPKSLWLYSGAGTLYVMKKNERGEVAMIDGGRSEGVDPEYIAGDIAIENDGGDW